MEIDAIGSVVNAANSAADLSNAALDQEDFLRLFLTELNFQDPLEPVDNKEFLAQIAQFAAIEQGRQTSENVESLVFMNSLQQSVGLIGQQVEIRDTLGNTNGLVSAVRFTEDGATLTVQLTNGSVVTDIRLSQVSLVRPAP